MKIGILTFHRALNYGAVLQCYALKTVLNGLGHDVEVIDYRPYAIEKSRKLFSCQSFKQKNLLSKLKYLCLTPSRIVYRKQAAKTFDSFSKMNFQFSRYVSSASDIPNYYDAIIFGSDQIWSPELCGGFDPIFWGDFFKGKTRFVSYAASLEGYKAFTPQDWAYIETLLSRFDGLSVREKAFAKELSLHTKHKAKWVVDPTLLVSPSILKKLVKKPPFDRYIFLFTVQPGDEPYWVAKNLSKQKNCVVVRARSTQRLNIINGERGVKNIKVCSPGLFLGLIYYSECVVTNSFHATAISLQFEKEFYAVNCKRSKRILDLLESTNLSDRYISSIDNINPKTTIDYPIVRSCLDKLSNSSLEYIIGNLR